MVTWNTDYLELPSETPKLWVGRRQMKRRTILQWLRSFAGRGHRWEFVRRASIKPDRIRGRQMHSALDDASKWKSAPQLKVSKLTFKDAVSCAKCGQELMLAVGHLEPVWPSRRRQLFTLARKYVGMIVKDCDTTVAKAVQET